MGDASEPMCCAGEVVGMGMLSGEAQQAEAMRIANLQTRSLSQAERDAIQRRRASCAARRRVALAKVDNAVGKVSPLQARIAQRRAAVQEADRCQSTVAAKGASVEMGMDSAGALPPTPQRHRGRLPLTAQSGQPNAFPKRQRKSRITLTAMTDALTNISSEANDGIHAAQELAAAIFGAGNACPDQVPHIRPSKPRISAKKRSVDGAPRTSVGSTASSTRKSILRAARDSIGSNIGIEEMVAKAALTAASRQSVCSSACGDALSDGDNEDRMEISGQFSPRITKHRSFGNSAADKNRLRLRSSFVPRRRRPAFVLSAHVAEVTAMAEMQLYARMMQVTPSPVAGQATEVTNEVTTQPAATSNAASFLPPPPARPVRKPAQPMTVA